MSLIAGINNGWDQQKDTNNSKTAELGITWAPVTAFTWTAQIYNGKETICDALTSCASTRDTNRFLFDTVATWKATDALTFVLNYDYGKEKNGAGSHDAQWTGFAAIARFNISGTFAFSVRGETFKDRDGARTGAAQRLTECTLTPEFKVKDRLVIRPELRFDRSNESTFEKSGGRTSKNQTTLALNTLYVF